MTSSLHGKWQRTRPNGSTSYFRFNPDDTVDTDEFSGYTESGKYMAGPDVITLFMPAGNGMNNVAGFKYSISGHTMTLHNVADNRTLYYQNVTYLEEQARLAELKRKEQKRIADLKQKEQAPAKYDELIKDKAKATTEDDFKKLVDGFGSITEWHNDAKAQRDECNDRYKVLKSMREQEEQRAQELKKNTRRFSASQDLYYSLPQSLYLVAG